ncbi:hypothetical protein psyc5s11_50860 [Clostridium gelidum]|uniref:Oligosaccharide repeat unit polymerase n=1 Tax=Clostridium gelidum TaxID=704125 RepID=A0ABM7TCT4_9CLOT|nr:O-antigen polysaccharide polymerase Wzy [Clostridium gelidum]BCZ49019.1 hypothetical protein psyc5s11_50860 [Clostridium gelidum]
MLLFTNFIAIIYIIFLFKRKYPVSLSMYWVVVFYAVYIFVPTVRNHITYIKDIPNQLVEEIALYSLVGLISFIATNQIFLFKWNKMGAVSRIEISNKATKNLVYFFVLIFILILMVTTGAEGLTKIFSTGSVNLLVEDKSIFDTFRNVTLFYLTILGSVLVLTARNIKEKKKSVILFVLIIIIIAIVGYARRVIIYPIFVVMFYYLSRIRNKTKILLAPLLIIPVLFIIMFLMGYIRTFGIGNLNIENIISYFKDGNFLDIFMSNTDFSASYYYLSKQISYGEIATSPLGYLKVLFAAIPRLIWESKPQYTSVSILSIIEPLKVSQGFSAATGYIGEALATMGVLGVVLVSAVWGTACGYLDKKYQYIVTKRVNDMRAGVNNKGFTIFEYMYLYIGALLITESHRGDFGAASMDFVLEVVFLGILLIFFSRKYKTKTI